MKTTARAYLLEVKEHEDKTLQKIDEMAIYELKFNRKKGAKSILYDKIRPQLDAAYYWGFRFGREVSKKVEEIEKGLTEEELKKYVKIGSNKAVPTKYRLTRLLVFKNAMAEIEIERKRFFSLYDLRVDEYLKDGYSRNQARTNIAVAKLENEVINRTRRVIENIVYLNCQIGQIDGMKGAKKQ